ncbi:cyclin-dependent kinase inhibitor 1B-like, partial [Sceloporus undulatus]|uniref:cyclin-dependent kinase inhibitor 1B-like n=1 Tax=Sceloporus undulatus TaxID=8520 RepID=UPI001C4C1EDE
MMSKVRLSSGSPSLERMETRQSSSSAESSPPKPSACCRSLFGPVDHRELARELRRHRREQEEASRARWNFDFQRHRPLRGRYQWQALGSQALPDFYSRPPRLRPGTQGGSGPPGGEEEEEDS